MMKKAEIPAACWAALRSMADKECRRDSLPGGENYNITLRISGEIATKPFAVEAEARVVVNEDVERLVSQAAPTPHLVAWLLMQMSRSERERIIRELPESFAANGGLLPDIDADLALVSEKLLERLRSKVQKQSRGAVSVSYVISSLTT